MAENMPEHPGSWRANDAVRNNSAFSMEILVVSFIADSSTISSISTQDQHGWLNIHLLGSDPSGRILLEMITAHLQRHSYIIREPYISTRSAWLQ